MLYFVTKPLILQLLSEKKSKDLKLTKIWIYHNYWLQLLIVALDLTSALVYKIVGVKFNKELLLLKLTGSNYQIVLSKHFFLQKSALNHGEMKHYKTNDEPQPWIIKFLKCWMVKNRVNFHFLTLYIYEKRQWSNGLFTSSLYYTVIL